MLALNSQEAKWMSINSCYELVTLLHFGISIHYMRPIFSNQVSNIMMFSLSPLLLCQDYFLLTYPAFVSYSATVLFNANVFLSYVSY